MLAATHILWREAMGRQKLGNHFGTASVLGRTQFVLREFVQKVQKVAILVYRREQHVYIYILVTIYIDIIYAI